jgi:pimeloyl-ACP methyl ester carboxylesterase
MPLSTRLLAAVAAGLVMTGAVVTPGPAGAAPSTAGPAAPSSAEVVAPTAVRWDRTGAAERRRVDSAGTPKLRWYSCYGWGQCATAKVPLDYDRPHGKQVTLALLRVKARDRKHRIGSLFVNPGGPGGSGVTMALAAPYFLSSTLLDHFDVVGMDPRGVGFSDEVNCFGDARRQAPVMRRLEIGFPWGAAQEKAYLTAVGKAARACSTTGRELAGAMSTAEVARDLELMRRAVGDPRLSYLGFSYGTAIGQYYADMFPDRVRAIAVDGVVYPRAWVGGGGTAGQIQDDRLRSADGAWKAFAELMRRCAAAGPAKCRFSDHPLRRFRVLTDRLKMKPVALLGDKVTYALFVSMLLGALYSPDAGDQVTMLASALDRLSTPGHVPTGAELAEVKAMVGRLRRQAEGRAFPYDNSFDAYAGPTGERRISAGRGRGRAPSARGTNGPCVTRTLTGDRSTTAPATPSWSSGASGTRPRITPTPSNRPGCCPTAGCCPATTGATPLTARRRARPTPSTVTSSAARCPPPAPSASASSSRFVSR